MRKNYERSRSTTPEQVEQRMSLISGSTSKSDFADCDIVIEAVFEDMALKKTIFARTRRDLSSPSAVLASNTSALDINEIASATSRPESVIGMHFFSPANVMKLLEVVRGDQSSDTVVATAMAVGKQVGKVAVLVGVCHGFVGNRMLFQRRLEADQLVLEGATPAQVDRVLYDFGFPMGPFAMSDLAGLDIGWKAENSTGDSIRDLMNESGRKGQKNGRGYYTYDPETRAATPDPEVEQMIKDFAIRKGHEQRERDRPGGARTVPLLDGQRGREDPRGGDRDPRQRHRRRVGQRLRLAGLPRRSDVLGRLDRPPRGRRPVQHYGETVGGRQWELSPLLAELAAEDGKLHQYSN